MHAHTSCAAVAAALISAGAHGSFTFDDIQFWAGDGANRAALVIDWNDGAVDESVAWGYRFDGATTGRDMLLAIITADANLYGRLGAFAWGTAVIGLGRDTHADGFAISDGTPFPASGVSWAGPSDGATALDPADHYAEGWNTGFWSYHLADDSPYVPGGAWAEAQVGIADRPLADGDWDGLSFAPDFAGPEPGLPIPAAPTPGTLALLAGGAMLVLRRSR